MNFNMFAEQANDPGIDSIRLLQITPRLCVVMSLTRIDYCYIYFSVM